MLDHVQLDKILGKEVLTPDDLNLLEYHLHEIKNLQDEYGENMPWDVDETLANDCVKIIERLKKWQNSDEGLRYVESQRSKDEYNN